MSRRWAIHDVVRLAQHILPLPVAALFVIIILSFYGSYSDPKLVIVDGSADLSNLDFNVSKVVRLDGTWLFYPDSYNDSDMEAQNITVPDAWNNTAMDGPYGYGTYLLHIILPEHAPSLGILIPDQAIAWECYIDEKKAIANGSPGRNYGSTRIRREMVLVPIPSGLTDMTLALRVANYHYDVGGLINPISIGIIERLQTLKGFLGGIDAFLLGALLIMAIYHVILFSIQREDKSALYFGLFCFLMAIRLITIAHYPERLIDVPWVFSMSTRLEYLCFYIGLPIYLNFALGLFSYKGDMIILKAYIILGALFSIAVLFLPIPILMAWTTKPYQFLTIIACFRVVDVFIRSVGAGRRGASLALAGFLVFFLFITNDILHANLIIRTAHLTPFGLLVFTISQAFVVAIRNGEHYRHEMQLAEELRHEKEGLDKRIEERTAQLKEANEKLIESDKSKSRVLAMLSHELRTPISLIVTPLEQLTKGKYGDSIPNDSKVFRSIKRNAYRLLTIVEGVFNYARIELGKLPAKMLCIDVGKTLDLFCVELRALTDKKKLRLNYISNLKEGTTIEVYPHLFEIAFFNIATNAIKYTPSGGSITVSLEEFTKQNETWIAIHIEDTGVGIDAEKLPSIFDKFYRPQECESHLYDGTGIGLSLTKKIVELHGAVVEVESELGRGSRFTILQPAYHNMEGASVGINTYPYKVEILAEADKVDLIDEDGRNTFNPTILIVEDNPDMLTFIQNELQTKFRIVRAGDGLEALRILQSNDPVDLVLSDIVMPQMDGLTLLKDTRKLQKRQHTPFIFLTANIDPQTQLMGLRDGALDYIHKPFNIDEVMTKIENYLDYKHQIQQEIFDNVRNRLSYLLDDVIDSPKAIQPSSVLFASGLKQNELLVVEHVVRGLQDKEVALEMHISSRTVSNILSRIYKKLNIAGRSELIRRALSSKEKGV